MIQLAICVCRFVFFWGWAAGYAAASFRGALGAGMLLGSYSWDAVSFPFTQCRGKGLGGKAFVPGQLLGVLSR